MQNLKIARIARTGNMTVHIRRSFIIILVFLILVVTGVILIIYSIEPRREDTRSINPATKFYVPGPNAGAIAQIEDLVFSAQIGNANLIREMTGEPQAVWLNGGSPEEVKTRIEQIIANSENKGQVPVLVAYNIPYRDCGSYSAGGVDSRNQYEAWINGFAQGIGNHNAIVILEPDSIGIIPYYKDIDGTVDSCRPGDANQYTAASFRFLMLNYAVDTLKSHSNTWVYLDGTQSRWLSVGDAAYRLVQAGVLRADGFFLNVSNYQPTEELIKYSTWVSKCIWYTTTPRSNGYGKFLNCASQYHPAKVDDVSTWGLTDDWYTENVENQSTYPGNSGLIHFVIDTSRNGQGKWIPPKGKYPDNQDWCNAPGRGLGELPTANTGRPLVDAYLWIKVPGESDGECTRGLGAAGETIDPEWGLIDPVSGEWFPEMALILAQNAKPPIH
jgi:endoglucanase